MSIRRLNIRCFTISTDKVEGSNVLTSFESISFKQFLDKTKEVEFNSEQGFNEI